MDFRSENMLILFGPEANGGLEDYSVIINKPTSAVQICVGDTIYLGATPYLVTAVGDKASETFSTLGHCTVRFDGASTPALPGTVHLQGTYPEIRIGDQVMIT